MATPEQRITAWMGAFEREGIPLLIGVKAPTQRDAAERLRAAGFRVVAEEQIRQVTILRGRLEGPFVEYDWEAAKEVAGPPDTTELPITA